MIANSNAENRNSIVSAQTNRIRNLRTIAQGRCCSFCRLPGHNINCCDDERIQNFEAECFNAKLLFETTADPINRFDNWLMQKFLENALLVKAFSIRKCHCTLRSNVQLVLNSIKNYIYNTLVVDEEENGDFMAFANETPRNTSEEGLLALAGILTLAGFNAEAISEFIISRLELIINDTYNLITTVEALKKEDQWKIQECAICFDDFQNKKLVKLNCEHKFCSDCMVKLFKTGGNCVPRCALCRTDISSIVTYSKTIEKKFEEFKK